ncbi:2OG-Fe(II) oxygenase family protein [Streptomyces sp. WP-1]|uniref:2OG-Fe(II) oxygenase family protein n=1 Tax=Streptomyces sp. WP-1 TaxID=3041497 RepID=UPI002648B1C8|nr:2OG-Fe(II) oxygenase family protein [Streptomyces sp. WP-1]WKE69207.1 2OG-Fe(II) oxygenase family protein [Streptomyces sp. WP-1]
MKLPTVDFARPGAAVGLRTALSATGCAVLVGAPVMAGTVERVYDEWLAFFDSDAKHRYAAGSVRPDGYFAPPRPTAGSDFVGDRKEFFHIYPRGRYPVEVPDTARRYYDEALALARTLLGWLDVPSATGPDPAPLPLARTTDGATATVLRVQRYLPAADGDAPDTERALAHTDINLLTLLPAPSGPGLQIQHDGTWLDVPAPTGSIVVQAGEMLQLATAGRYPAALHRVVHPGGASDSGSRMSLPLFVHPADDTELEPGCTAAGFRAERIAQHGSRGWNVVAGGSRERDGG